jgi:hypothetical protein
MPRRRLLFASATALPLLLATTGCSSADLFAGPDPLGGRPPLAPDTVTLENVIVAEVGLISQYKSVMSVPGSAGSAGSAGGIQWRLLASLLAQHEEHLVKLRARLVVPPGVPAPATAPASSSSSSSASASASSSGAASSGAASADPIGTLRAAERRSATFLVQRLATVQPALAQLFASIAASDATHAAALSGLGR